MKMKTSSFKLTSALVTGFLFFSLQSFAQEKKLPDGSIVYPDGTRKLPNGTVIYKEGRNTSRERGNYPEGTVILPDGSRRYPGDDRRYKHPGNLPPGQAKKIYGAQSARDFAPGHQKKWKGNKGKK